MESVPLAVEDILHELVELDVVLELLGPVLDCLRLAELDVVVPVGPGSAAEFVLQRHEKRVVVEPVLLFDDERGVAHVVGEPREGLPQEGGLVAVHDVEVNVGRVCAVVGVVEGLLREVAVLHKLVKVDEQWIPREGGKRLVGGIAVSGGAYRQHLPVLLAGFLEPVGEFFSFRPECSYAIRGRQAGNVH